LSFVNDSNLDLYAGSGPLTPDHVIRTKRLPLVLGVNPTQESVNAAVRQYCASYNQYFEEESQAAGGQFIRLDSLPRVVLVPEVGMFTVGKTIKDAGVAADIYEHTITTKRLASGLGAYLGLNAAKLFEMEYWSLEQAKLGRGKEPDLSRKVALITGAAGAIGLGVARILLDAGAHVVLADVNEEALGRASELLNEGARVRCVHMDIRSSESVHAGFREACRTFGGIDFVVANAGVAAVGALESLEEEDFERVMEVNLTGTWLTLRESARLLKEQGTGGHIVVISSKNVFGPGADFGAYSASKAGGHQLGKIAAIELASADIRVNMVTPDAVFSQGLVPSGLWREVGPDRARSKGLPLTELAEHYRQRNLLKLSITGEDVGRAVLFFVRGDTPTTGATLPVDGGVVTAFPR
jgi:NAD(P)-dependent dehydrogenase (short-subunit alcohol dehydrogenase family)